MFFPIGIYNTMTGKSIYIYIYYIYIYIVFRMGPQDSKLPYKWLNYGF